MHIRPAETRDLEACIALNHSYSTGHVWQMETRGEHDVFTITFREARLPREMRVEYPLNGDDLRAAWRQRSEMLVAEDEGRICGYISLTLCAEHCTLWVNDLVVDRPLRQRGIGTALLRAAARWGRERGMERLVCAVQTKNSPAIRFCQSHGLTLCGYHDHYWRGQDIALFFGAALR